MRTARPLHEVVVRLELTLPGTGGEKATALDALSGLKARHDEIAASYEADENLDLSRTLLVINATAGDQSADVDRIIGRILSTNADVLAILYGDWQVERDGLPRLEFPAAHLGRVGYLWVGSKEGHVRMEGRAGIRRSGGETDPDERFETLLQLLEDPDHFDSVLNTLRETRQPCAIGISATRFADWSYAEAMRAKGANPVPTGQGLDELKLQAVERLATSVSENAVGNSISARATGMLGAYGRVSDEFQRLAETATLVTSLLPSEAEELMGDYNDALNDLSRAGIQWDYTLAPIDPTGPADERLIALAVEAGIVRRPMTTEQVQLLDLRVEDAVRECVAASVDIPHAVTLVGDVARSLSTSCVAPALRAVTDIGQSSVKLAHNPIRTPMRRFLLLSAPLALITALTALFAPSLVAGIVFLVAMGALNVYASWVLIRIGKASPANDSDELHLVIYPVVLVSLFGVAAEFARSTQPWWVLALLAPTVLIWFFLAVAFAIRGWLTAHPFEELAKLASGVDELLIAAVEEAAVLSPTKVRLQDRAYVYERVALLLSEQTEFSDVDLRGGSAPENRAGDAVAIAALVRLDERELLVRLVDMVAREPIGSDSDVITRLGSRVATDYDRYKNMHSFLSHRGVNEQARVAIVESARKAIAGEPPTPIVFSEQADLDIFGRRSDVLTLSAVHSRQTVRLVTGVVQLFPLVVEQ